MFERVSILFSDVVTFTEICSRITPMEVVSMLNGMYSIFDTLTERNRVYKVGNLISNQHLFSPPHYSFFILILLAIRF